MRARTLCVLVIGLVLITAGAAVYLASTATGTLAIRIKDATVSWSHVTVTFDQVAVHPANAANNSTWITLNLTARQIDFLELGNLTELLALDRLPAGKYTQIRIIVLSVEGVLANGPSVTMSVPDGTVKTTTPFDLQGGGTTTVTLDLDLAHSIHQVNGQWQFKPVLGPVNVG